MRFAVLGSGSGGNCTVVECGGKYLLVDVGLSAKQLVLRLEKLGVSLKAVKGILLTHEHGDHVRGLDVFLRKVKVPVLASVMTGRVVQEGLKEQVEWVAFESGQKFSWEGFEISTFALPHDAVEPVGYVIGMGERKMGVATVVDLRAEGLRKLVLGHLSGDCNCPVKAVEAVRGKLSEDARDGLEICAASQDEVTVWQSLEPEIDPAFYGELFGGL